MLKKKVFIDSNFLENKNIEKEKGYIEYRISVN